MLSHSLFPYIDSNEQLCCHPYFCSSGSNVSFFSGYFQMLSIVLNNLIIMCLGVVFFLLLVLGICWTSLVYTFLVIILGNYSAIISSYTFFSSPPAKFLSFEYSNYTSVRLLDIFAQLINVLLFFPIFLDSSWYHVFSFTNIFFCNI